MAYIYTHPEMEKKCGLSDDFVIVRKDQFAGVLALADAKSKPANDDDVRPLVPRGRMLDDDIDVAQVTSFGRVSVLILSSRCYRELSDSIIGRIEDKTTTKFKGEMITLSKYRGLKVVESNDVDDYLIV